MSKEKILLQKCPSEPIFGNIFVEKTFPTLRPHRLDGMQPETSLSGSISSLPKSPRQGSSIMRWLIWFINFRSQEIELLIYLEDSNPDRHPVRY